MKIIESNKTITPETQSIQTTTDIRYNYLNTSTLANYSSSNTGNAERINNLIEEVDIKLMYCN